MIAYTLLFFCIQTFVYSDQPECGDFHNINPGETCEVRWLELKTVLRPAQTGVGYAWVQSKVDNDFSTISDAKAEMKATALPIVLGPSRIPYLLDGTHTLSALDFSGWDIKVTVALVCDWSSDSPAHFWRKMIAANYVYLLIRPDGDPNALPVLGTPDDLPQSLNFRGGQASMRDDRWRSWAGFNRKVRADHGTIFDDINCSQDDKSCMRGYVRVCNSDGTAIPFYEFRWGYFMNTAYVNQSLWEDEEGLNAFRSIYESIPFPQSIGTIDTKPWKDGAAQLTKLCRGNSADRFVLPLTLGPPLATQFLPGYISGMGPTSEANPECETPRCFNHHAAG